MANTATLKKYPRLQLSHQGAQGDFTQIPNAVIFSEISHGDFRVYVKLRWAMSKQYKNLSHLANTINVDRSNLEKAVKRLADAGVMQVVETSATRYWKTLTPGEGQPQTESQEEQPKKEKEEEKTEQPATRERPAPPRKIETPTASAANPPSLAAELAEIWNSENKRGYLRGNVNAGAFTEPVVNVVQHIAKSYGVTPREVVARIVGRWDSREQGTGYTPAYVFAERNKDDFGGDFYEERMATRKKYYEEREERQREIVNAAYEGLMLAHTEMGTEKPEMPDLEDDHMVSSNEMAATYGLKEKDQEPDKIKKIAYAFSALAKAEGQSITRVFQMYTYHGSNQHLAGLLEAAQEQVLSN